MSSVKNVETIEKRIATQGTGAVLSAGLHQDGFLHNTGMSPRPSAVPQPTINIGGEEVETFGADIGDDFDHGSGTEPERVYERKTPAGNIIEMNDTSGSERIMIKHASGVGINIGPDGSVLVSSTKRVDVCNDSYTFTLNGDGKLTYHGNLDLHVDGDYNVTVNGNYNMKALSKNEDIRGASQTRIKGDMMTTVKGNQSNLVTGGGTIQYLEGLQTIVKGESMYSVTGNHTMACSGILTMTAEQEVVLTSVKTHIAADTLSVFGDQGTMGGDNVIMYNQNMYTNEHVSAKHVSASARVITPVTYGDLQGTALKAVTSDVTNSQNYADPDPGGGTGSAAGYTAATDTSTINTDATAKPTADNITDYKKGSKGIKKVLVDPNNDIKNNLDLTVKTGGVSDEDLNVELVRKKLRDPAHRNNPEFIAYAQSLNLLSPDFAKNTPPSVNSVESVKDIIIQGDTPMGNTSAQYTAKRVRAV